MTTTGPDDPQAPLAESKVAPENLELRTPPQPVTRINRKVLIGAAAVVLLLIAGLVLLALRAPSLRVAAPQELFNVEHKPIADALSKLRQLRRPAAGQEGPGSQGDGTRLAEECAGSAARGVGRRGGARREGPPRTHGG